MVVLKERKKRSLVQTCSTRLHLLILRFPLVSSHCTWPWENCRCCSSGAHEAVTSYNAVTEFLLRLQSQGLAPMSGNQFLWRMMFMFFSGKLEDTTYVYHLVAKPIAAQNCSRLCCKGFYRKSWRGTVGCMGTWALRTWLLTFTENQTWCSSLGWCEVVWTVGCKMCLSYHNMTLNGKRWAMAPQKKLSAQLLPENFQGSLSPHSWPFPQNNQNNGISRTIVGIAKVLSKRSWPWQLALAISR